ncbi:MCM-domain-containing protein [Rozella allomycis CSF55]|uniref:DNA replication licensing factor MCM5 n=1 Tax=Rozella allomycis (strain CSF55) TaxID=988480 RepID=A0A4P9YLD6_ROZAC|nr:MCM-domain-containing protein [Rozella allomycis CSF55]
MCKNCRHVMTISMADAMGSSAAPRTCGNCPVDPYIVVPDASVCVDQQYLKLQESLEDLPVGELPRHILLTVDRYNVNRIVPGSKIELTGVFSINQNKKSKGNESVRNSFVKVTGFKIEQEKEGFGGSWSNEEERQFIEMSRDAEFYNKFSQAIAPSIFGSDDIKKAVACLLFGGSRKFLPDGVKIRGDINVLLLGDPGTAKSQFLKFAEKVKLHKVRNGKGSSAAGLTASVIKDGGGEFYLEGGAMVLADGGIVCIDEFDKMRDEDRVAIHEAMEQQTISIAKAGITTILNSRTSVLAAANPIFGRYDELKTPGENIDFSSTILSRFDMIFIVKDEHNKDKDITLAKHVLNVHTDKLMETPNDINIKLMRDYIRYCKGRCAPRLSLEASEKLSDYYVSIRSQVKQMEQETLERSSIPITIRQLEAIIRITEALAKMTLSPIATINHVDEALRLFRVSTIQAVNAGHSVEGLVRPGYLKEVENVENIIKRRLPVGSSVSFQTLIKELTNKVNYFILFNVRDLKKIL